MHIRKALRYWPQFVLGVIAVSVVVTAWAGYRQQSGYSWQERNKKRKEILAKVPNQPDILINITYDLMPGTPDLTALGRTATPALVRGLLDNASDSVRGLCASVLAEIRDPDAGPALVEALGDRSSTVRFNAVYGLGNLALPQYGKHLLDRINDPEENSYVKRTAIQAIGKMGYRKGLRPLFSLVRSEKTRQLQWQALNALWYMRNRVDRDDLVDIYLYVLKENQSGAAVAIENLGRLRASEASRTLAEYYVGRNSNLKNQIILAMGKIGDSRARRFLKDVLQETQVARHLNNAAIALARLDEKKEAVSILLKLLKDRKAYLRINATFALGEINANSDRAVKALIQALRDKNDYVRSEAAVALGRLKSSAAEGALRALADTNNPFVVLDAVIALNRIDYKKHRHLIFEKLLVHDDPKLARIPARGMRFLAEQGDEKALPHLLEQLRSNQNVHDVLELLKNYDVAQLGQFEASLLYLAHVSGGNQLSNLLRLLRNWKLDGFKQPLLERLYRTGSWGNSRTLLYFTLGKIGDEGTAKSLEEIKERRHTNELYRTFALANLGNKVSLKKLLDTLKNGNLEDKRDASFLLGNLDGDLAMTELRALMKQDDPYIAVGAAAALLNRGEKNAFDFLYKMMKEGIPVLAAEAERVFLIAKNNTVESYLSQQQEDEGQIVTKRRVEEILYRRAPKEFR